MYMREVEQGTNIVYITKITNQTKLPSLFTYKKYAVES